MCIEGATTAGRDRKASRQRRSRLSSVPGRTQRLAVIGHEGRDRCTRGGLRTFAIVPKGGAGADRTVLPRANNSP